jgi:NADH:ubiquinone reductase (H+-translocating)
LWLAGSSGQRHIVAEDRRTSFSNQKHRVVVIGGGFGGIYTTRALATSPVEVMLLDRTNHHLFQPLLYEVATGLLSEGMIAPPLRGILKYQANARTFVANVTDLDLEAREVIVVTPDAERRIVPYDSLVVAAGATHAYFGHDEWAEFAPGMKSLEDARHLRSHILSAYEMAELAFDPAIRASWLTFVIIGAGPTGVELAGQIAELSHRVLPKDYRKIDTRESKILLLDAAPAVLNAFSPKLQQYTARRLEKMGVTVEVNTMALDMDETSITVKGPDGERRIEARTKVWAAGVQANPLAALLAKATGAELDRAGRVSVLPDCTLPGYPEVFAIGDMVSLNGLPGVAQPAMQEGKYVAKTITDRIYDRPPNKPFEYFDKGSMATIGRFRAVAEAFGLKMTGFLAFGAWAFIHVLYLIGWGHRIGTMIRWSWSLLLTSNRGERLITLQQAHDEVVHSLERAPASSPATEDPKEGTGQDAQPAERPVP